jgi:lipid-A-disaccharide synthase-like uncharacterized protein
MWWNVKFFLCDHSALKIGHFQVQRQYWLLIGRIGKQWGALRLSAQFYPTEHAVLTLRLTHKHRFGILWGYKKQVPILYFLFRIDPIRTICLRKAAEQTYNR